MRNLSLQGEVRHAFPLRFHREHHDECTGRFAISGKIVAVIRNTSADGHVDLDFQASSFDYHRDDANDATAASDSFQEGGDLSSHGLSKQPPAVFVMTSEGKLLALDDNDRLVWLVDLEKVVLDSKADQDDEEGVQATSVSVDAGSVLAAPHSEWFYAGGFLQEATPEASSTNNTDTILGVNINDRASLHITCLSHAGHVVSVSVDSTNSVVSYNGSPEDGSECIGSFENGLQCGGWSPDGEVLALVTFASEDEEGNAVQVENDQFRLPILMTMNTQYEILAEVRLEPCLHAGHSSNNNSGTPEEAIRPNPITFCWRPDSSSLAVSTMDANVKPTDEKSETNPLRRIRTFSRTTLQLLSLSKEEDGSGRDVPNLLPAPPTWAPAGCSHYVGAIQSSRSLSSKTSARGRPITMQVAFMEPNGLRHRECKIHMTYDRMNEKEEVVGVAFNLDGDLLAVTSLVTPLTTGSQSEPTSLRTYGKLQLYHRSNYHWYLKYEMRYCTGVTASSSAIISMAKFSEKDPYQITVALDRRHIHQVDKKFHALEWREYTFRWDSSTVYYSNKSTGKKSSVLALAIDGKTLHMTPLDLAIIPPPMYASSLEFPAPVVGIATRPCFFHEHSSRSDGDWVDFLVTMSDGKFALLNFDLCGKGISLTPGFIPPSIVAIVDVPGTFYSDDKMDILPALEGAALRDMTIIDANKDSFTVIAVSSLKPATGKHNNFDNLIEMNVSWNTSIDTSQSPTVEVTITSSLPLREGRALRIVNWSDTAFTERARGSALVELSDGGLFIYSHGGILEPLGLGHLLEPCPWIVGLFDPHGDFTVSSSSIAASKCEYNESSNPFVIGLSSRYRLYCGERLISSATSSFEISLQHSFLTHVTLGSRPQMRFLPLANLLAFDPLMGSDENAALDGYEPRTVERGSRLVALFTNSPSVVIQLPRGNLESISPRALALPYVMMKIRDRDYSTALDIMRRQRIDTNLVVDFDAKDFLENGGAEAFVDQIVKIDNINLFLSSLIDVDTTLWKYPIPSWLKAENQPGKTCSQNIEVPSKVNRVCAKMREIMSNAENNGATLSGKMVHDGHFLLPILSTFAKEVPPRLEEALTLIKSSASHVQLKHQRKTSVLLSDHVQNSIQYLAFLADYELIFNTAIGMYDFDLAKAVARHSQMDPKVYLSLLQRWRSLPDAAARFDVDVKLNRYESALRHLVSSGESEEPGTHFEKCLKFIEDHKLHRLGLELFINSANFTRAIMVSLGESFMTERKFEEALTVFLTSEPKYFDGAKRAARACGDWRTYFTICCDTRELIENDQVTSIAESISSKVRSPKEQQEAYAAAARILLDYGHDVAYAIDMFIAAQMWFEARRVSHKHNRADLVKKCADAAASYAASCIEDFSERASTFETTNDRYAEVIMLRRDAIKEADETGVPEHHDDSASLFSMQSTASNSSLRSTASGASIGSIGSVTSVSTVISIGAKSTFQFTGDRDTLKHKSKFNKIGRDRAKKKKKKDGPAARRTKPGSEEHLKELVLVLTNSCPDEHYVTVVSDTISFLLQSGKQPLAKCLFEAYHELDASVTKSQNARLDCDKMHRQEKEMHARKEGFIYENVEHPCEKEVNALRCKPLPSCVENVMSYLLI